MHNLKELKIWKKAMALSRAVYQVSAEFPADERFGLISQVRRAAVSVVSNIAEGAGRNSKSEFIYFLGISNGSLYELQTQMILVMELGLAQSELIEPILLLIEELQKMNYGLQKSLQPSLKTAVQ